MRENTKTQRNRGIVSVRIEVHGHMTTPFTNVRKENTKKH
jgi:hypothetical protein